MSGGCLVGVWRVSGWCLDGVLMVSGWCLDGVWKVSGPKIFCLKNSISFFSSGGHGKKLMGWDLWQKSVTVTLLIEGLCR